ncbi:Flagella-related protein FlaI [Dehalogenimonas sp. WBC-2]|nr:Flagella-related protein FlaI [Dehalogenimonas sp. WBC-2]
MTTTIMPFDWETEVQSSRKSRIEALNQNMPPELFEVTQANPHLLEYLSMLPLSQIGLPEYHSVLTKELGDLMNPNVIYPIKDNLFVHIVVDQKDSRNCYIPIEPSSTYDVSSLLQRVEVACIDYGHELPEFDDNGDRVKQLLHYIDLVTTASKVSIPVGVKDKSLSPLKKKKHLEKIRATPREAEIVKYLFIRDKLGMGELEPLAWDHYIEDIGCAGLGPIFIEHKIFKSLKCSINFTDMEDLDNFVLRLAEKIQKPLSLSSPIIDATLESGSRINIVYGSEVSKRGSNFTIRHFEKIPISIFDLINFGTVNYLILAYLSMVISNGMNLFVAGESASGKTSMLNAITTFIHPLSKIITIEDTPELQVPHDNWIREVVQTTRANDTTGVTTFDLLKAALRQRPNEILVGEIRGPEGNVAFQAMQTGHSVMTTFHASSVEKLIQRITSNPILVPKSYIDNLNVVVLMNMVKLRNGKYARRITSIAEIAGYDSLSDSFNIVEVFRWDEVTDKFNFTGHMSSYILEYKIAPRLGFSSTKKTKVYDELNKRANILEKLHRDQNITGFYEILSVLGKAQREGLF